MLHFSYHNLTGLQWLKIFSYSKVLSVGVYPCSALYDPVRVTIASENRIQ